MKLPISALIVGYNEANLLKNCLGSLQFCDEILYFDLGSSDGSIDIAISLGAQVIKHERVLGCEWIHTEYGHKTKHNWIIITDPDEVMSPALIQNLIDLIKQNALSDAIGSVTVPWMFYFKETRLKGTTWGGINYRILLINNKRFEFSPYVHRGRKLKTGFSNYTITYNGLNEVYHYWMSGYSQLIEKHLRYLKNEGESRYNNGEWTSLRILLKTPLKAFKYSFFFKKGYRDGFTGIFLSLFWSWYETVGNYNLLKYQNKKRKIGA